MALAEPFEGSGVIVKVSGGSGRLAVARSRKVLENSGLAAGAVFVRARLTKWSGRNLQPAGPTIV